MKFYEIDGALQEAIEKRDKPVRLKIEIESEFNFFHRIMDQDIIEANFFGLKEVSGGTSARGELFLDNFHGAYSFNNVLAGAKVKISFTLGDTLSYFERFVFYIDDKGIQDIKGNGRKKYIYIGLQDLSYKLRKSDEARDWTSPAVFTYSVVCDKTQNEKSLVHGIAKRAGLNENDIDCSTIPVTLPYVRLRKNIWAELSSLAAAYRCHLECAPEKPLVFAHSPYQTEAQNENDYSHTFYGNEIFYLRKTARADYYRNNIRLKINMPVSLEKQQIWHYDESPVIYDELLRPYYPFKYSLEREIEISKYEAKYRIIDENGKEKNVVFADEIDTQEEAESRLIYDGCILSYSFYDVTSNYDKAVLTLKKDIESDLFNASIHGRPIVLDLNRSCFMRDDDGIAKFGTAALNISGSYFSDYEIDGKPQYEDWVIRELAERIQNKKEFTVKTHCALFNARIGAKVKICLENEEMSGTINAFSFRYKKDNAFVSGFKIMEGENEFLR